MIENQTLFILGAGAHIPYGMPLGADLSRLIVNLVSTKNFRSRYTQIYYSTGVFPIAPHVDHFQARFEYAAQLSIDEFLRKYHAEPGFAEIGRLAVAEILLNKEYGHNFGRSDRNAERDWMSKLFNLMYRGTDGTLKDFLEKNRVHFVAFNYDRILEHFFYHRLKDTFNLSPSYAIDALDRIEIQHVYGSLGSYDPGGTGGTTKQGFVNNDYKVAADGIRLMHDVRRQPTPAIERSRELYLESEVIVFLGFAFDEQNIKTLELNVKLKTSTVYATRYMMCESDWAHSVRGMQPGTVDMADSRWDCLALLENVYLA